MFLETKVVLESDQLLSIIVCYIKQWLEMLPLDITTMIQEYFILLIHEIERNDLFNIKCNNIFFIVKYFLFTTKITGLYFDLISLIFGPDASQT